MNIGIVAPMAVPVTWGGAERAVDGLARAIEAHTPHQAEVVKLPVDESSLPGLVAAYRDFDRLDVSRFDRVVSVKYPAWMVRHPRHSVLMFHPLRGLYDTYHTFGLPWHPSPTTDEVHRLRSHLHSWGERAALPEFFDLWTATLAALGPHHPDLAFPGPLAREIVHWLDRIALTPGNVEQHFALSRTVARREHYFPPGVLPKVVHLPGDLPPASPRTVPGHHLFTASRLDGPKRIDLIIDAMAYVPGDVALRIAGTGPLADELRARAAHDPRISFCGFVPDEALATMLHEAIAVPFVPDEEDLGLVTLEAFSQGAPVVTGTDSGGPTEFVVDGVTGLVVPPDAASLGRGLARLVRDRTWALELGASAQRRGARVTWQGAVQRLLGSDARPGLATPPPPAPLRSWRNPPAAAARRPKVLVLATFTIDAPRHGGELRARNLYGALARTADVHLLALVVRGHGAGTRELAPGLTQTVVPRTLAHAEADDEVGAQARLPVTDILSGLHADRTPAFAAALRAASADADLVLLAEPYLFPALLAADIDLPVVYDAYNVEASLKDGALPDTAVRPWLLCRVEAIERAAVTESAAITTCSDDDARDLANRYSRNRASFTTIPNGTSVLVEVPSPAERDDLSLQWRRRYRRSADLPALPRALAVFFGSWHPPNLDAAELIAEVAADLPDVLFLSCGGHGEAFRERIVPRNLVFPGAVTARVKAKLLASADLALNPMRTGSGTNLKLIEYLTAAIPVVSTPFGARGVDVIDGHHLLLATPENFGPAIERTLGDPTAAAERAAAGRAVAAGYDWSVLGDRLAAVVHAQLGVTSAAAAAS